MQLLIQYLPFTFSDSNCEYFENFDLSNVITPIDVDKFQQLLWESKYDIEESKFLISGLRNGFDIGYEGDREITCEAKKHSLQSRSW